jgi:PAS domain S-box-containing protein
MNNGELSILILEDVATDAELMELELTEAGLNFASQRVWTKAAFVEALEARTPDIMLSDYSLPSFDGLSALEIARSMCPEIPFIFVSGALGEERAIELLKQGATDYVLKHRLSRLAPAVSRALQEVAERNERKRFELELKESEDRYRTIFENTGTATVIVREDATIVLANMEFERLTGHSRQNIAGKKTWTDFIVPDDLAVVENVRRPREAGSGPWPAGIEFRMVGRQDETIHVLANMATIPSTRETVISLLDITERKKMEEALHESEALYHHFFQSSVAGTFRTVYDATGVSGWYMDLNDAHARILGYGSRRELLERPLRDSFLNEHDLASFTHDLLEKRTITNYQFLLRKKNGTPVHVLLNATMHDYRSGLLLVEGTMVDISDWVAAEKKLLDSNENLRQLTSELVMTEERERRRIAVDLHDNIGQNLALTRIKLDSLAELAAQCGFGEQLQKIQEMVNQSIQQIRSLMVELSPYVLYELGFMAAIEWLSEQIQDQHGLTIHIRNDLKNRPIDEEAQILMFRATRELLLNVVKHAGAKQVWIAIENQGNDIRIVVRDDGSGFDTSGIGRVSGRAGGFGLISIRERLNYLGGRFEIESEKGQGTCVTIAAPRKRRKKRREK